jgi:hypothetical protein
MADEVVTSIKRPTKGRVLEPGEPEEAEAVTGRPNDVPGANSTMAARKRAREGAGRKQVDEAENKSVKAAETKSGR